MDKKYSASCPFCNENVNRTQFAESEKFWAIYNRAPILPGHSLVIPKQHYQSIIELTDKELCEMMVFSRKALRILCKTFNVDAFNWTIQEGIAAGQTVPHLHLHLIPRKIGDLPEPGDWYPLLKRSDTEAVDSKSREQLTPEQMDSIVKKIRQVSIEVDNEK